MIYLLNCQLNQVILRDEKDGQGTLKSRTLTHCSFTHFLLLGSVTPHSLCFPSYLPGCLYPVSTAGFSPSAWHVTLHCPGALFSPLFFSMYISLLVISYSSMAFNIICGLMTPKYTSLAQMTFFIPDSCVTAYSTCPDVNFTYPGRYVRRIWSSMSTLLYLKLSPSHFMATLFFLLLWSKPLSSCLISWFLLKSMCKEFCWLSLLEMPESDHFMATIQSKPPSSLTGLPKWVLPTIIYSYYSQNALLKPKSNHITPLLI